MTDRRPSPWTPAAGAAALAALLYAVTLAGTFAYDDTVIIQGDDRLRHPGQWRQIWAGDYFNGNNVDNLYRPLTTTSYAVQWWTTGDRPWPFHAANVLLHAAAAAAVAELARRVAGAAAAWPAGLLFAAHPAHAEAVANVVGRAELAAAAALLGSLVLLARRPLTPARAVAAVAAGVVALLCKEQGLLAPLLWGTFAVLVWRPRPAGRERSVAGATAVVALWLWAAYVLAREHWLRFDWDRTLLDRAMQPLAHAASVDRLLQPVALLGRYAALLAWPAHLSPDYGGDVIGATWRPTDPYFWVGVAVALVWGITTVMSVRRRAGFALFCLLSLAASYALVGNVVTLIGTIFGERLIYLPSAFVAVLAGLAAAKVRPPIRWPLLAAVLVPMAAHTVRSAAEWSHPRELYARALADHPGSIQLHLLLAAADHDAGRPAERRAVLDDACRRFPDYWRCWADHARAAADAGDFAIADADLRYALARAFNPALAAAREYVSDREAAARRK